MANTVIALKKSGTVSAAPSALANGELAINYADGKLFYKNVTGSIVAITSGGASSNSFATINANGSLITAVSNNSTLTLVAGSGIAISSDIINDIITISSTGGGGGGASVNVGTSAPAAPTDGNLWWNTNEGTLYIYYTDVDSSQWVQASPMTNPAPVVTGGYYQGNRGSIGETAGLGDIFRVHANTITADITIPGGYNALAAGPLRIQDGKKLTIGDGSRAVIV